ncbi:MAG: DUF1003 domain-containing protein [Ktedonobacterales bacterium]
MLKWISPLFNRMDMVPRPRLFTVSGHSHAESARPTAGQRLAERVAASVGSWWFLGGQSGFLVLWLIYNTFQFTRHFDPPPYILLNLLLSFQAAFTGPVLLIAANVGALRDHKQSDRIEHLSAQNETMAEQNRQLVEQLVSLEHMVDEHVAASIRAHTLEIRQLYGLVREVHSVVTGQPLPDNAEALAVDPTAALVAFPADGASMTEEAGSTE